MDRFRFADGDPPLDCGLEPFVKVLQTEWFLRRLGCYREVRLHVVEFLQGEVDLKRGNVWLPVVVQDGPVVDDGARQLTGFDAIGDFLGKLAGVRWLRIR